MTVLSIERAGTNESGNQFKKDKINEIIMLITPEEATNLRDTEDQILFPRFMDLIKRIHRVTSGIPG
jgi:hypothetical protein